MGRGLFTVMRFKHNDHGIELNQAAQGIFDQFIDSAQDFAIRFLPAMRTLQPFDAGASKGCMCQWAIKVSPGCNRFYHGDALDYFHEGTRKSVVLCGLGNAGAD
jgi:hypothetical protein